jgi:hypothetical protein
MLIRRLAAVCGVKLPGTDGPADDDKDEEDDEDAFEDADEDEPAHVRAGQKEE